MICSLLCASSRAAETVMNQLPDVGDPRSHRDPGCGEGLHLALWTAPLVVADDGARVTHARVLRAALAGDVGDHRLAHRRGVLRRRIFESATGLANQDHE